MKANSAFTHLGNEFWAYVRYLSQELGYTDKKDKSIKKITVNQIEECLKQLDIDVLSLNKKLKDDKSLRQILVEYFNYRSDLLHREAQPNFMRTDSAKELFDQIVSNSKLSKDVLEKVIPTNKQKGSKKKPAYFTSIINILVLESLCRHNLDTCNTDPRKLAFLFDENGLKYTFSRRFDGAFPDISNPIAVWEIKEYYHTTTFGSRVADGVYESQLDGFELIQAQQNTKSKVLHYLFIDAEYTWWQCGRSYLCRIVDMIHMGLIDEVICGRQVQDAIPELVDEWVKVSSSKIVGHS